METRSKIGLAMKMIEPNDLENQLLACQNDVFFAHSGSIFQIDPEKDHYACNLCLKRK